MATVQLRRYEIKDGAMGAMEAWFPRLIPVREKFGFTVLFAFVDRSTNQFVWAVSHDGDFDEAEKRYMASPERAAVFEGVAPMADVMHVTKVDVLVAWAGARATGAS